MLALGGRDAEFSFKDKPFAVQALNKFGEILHVEVPTVDLHQPVPKQKRKKEKEAKKKMEIRVIFLEVSDGRTAWFTCDPNALPCSFDELNGSAGFRNQYPGVLHLIQGDINEWQRLSVMNGVHFLMAHGTNGNNG